ncbi:MAG: extracellular solute-binding protein [Clostridia bacterium]|nr:extracellular solute-binding protein [Clostridia bacterium]
MKKLLAALLALIMVLSMGSSAFAADVELTLWTPPVFAIGYMDALYDLIARFEEANPGVTIEVEELNWDGIGEKLESAMMTETTPDIYIDGTARTAKLPSTALCVDVSDVLETTGNWNEGAINIGKVDDAYYLVPVTLMPSTILAVNVDLAKQYGVYEMLPEDRMSWDWEDFMAFLKACGEKSLTDGVYPIGLFAGSQSSDIAYYTMLLSAGANVLNADHTEAAINTPEAVQVLANVKEIVDNGLTYPGIAEMTDEQVMGVFLNQKVVVDLTLNGGVNGITMFNEMVTDGLIEKAPVVQGYAWPTMNGSATNIGNWGANCAAIFENEGDEDKIAAAKDFLAFMATDKAFNETLWASAPSYGPARTMDIELKLEDEAMIAEVGAVTHLAAYNNSSFGILESYWGEIRQYFYPNLQSLVLGNKTPEEAISSFEASVNEVLQYN